jgi:hypothetical protein
VIRHDVEDDAQATFVKGRGHAVEGGGTPDLGIEGIVIGNVIAVGAAGPLLKHGERYASVTPSRSRYLASAAT